MSESTRHFPQSNASADRMRERTQTRHVGTFADGQRAVPLTVTYSDEIGSFGDTEQN
jgi:hypothetical protein